MYMSLYCTKCFLIWFDHTYENGHEQIVPDKVPKSYNAADTMVVVLGILVLLF